MWALQVLLVVFLGTAWSPESGGPGAGVQAASIGRAGSGNSYSVVVNNRPAKSYRYATHHPASGSYVAAVDYGTASHAAPSSAATKIKTPAAPAVRQAAASTSGRGGVRFDDYRTYLPVDYTPEVKKARKLFFKLYDKQARMAALAPDDQPETASGAAKPTSAAAAKSSSPSAAKVTSAAAAGVAGTEGVVVDKYGDYDFKNYDFSDYEEGEEGGEGEEGEEEEEEGEEEEGEEEEEEEGEGDEEDEEEEEGEEEEEEEEDEEEEEEDEEEEEEDEDEEEEDEDEEDEDEEEEDSEEEDEDEEEEDSEEEDEDEEEEDSDEEDEDEEEEDSDEEDEDEEDSDEEDSDEEDSSSSSEEDGEESDSSSSSEEDEEGGEEEDSSEESSEEEGGEEDSSSSSSSSSSSEEDEDGEGRGALVWGPQGWTRSKGGSSGTLSVPSRLNLVAPKPVTDTPEVQRAKKRFFDLYKVQAELARLAPDH